MSNSDTNITIDTTTETINLQVSSFTDEYNLTVFTNEAPSWGTIVGTLSSQTDLYRALSGSQGSSNTDFIFLSSQISATNTFLFANSGSWNSTYLTVQSNSATTWNYQGTDLKNLSSDWVGGNSAYSYINSISATNNPTYNIATFAKLSSQAYSFIPELSSIVPIYNSNIVSGCFSNIAGGYCNTASGNYSNIAGGVGNKACKDYSVVVGGCANIAYGKSSTVSGGYGSVAGGDNSVVGGGYVNTAGGDGSVISGGYTNNSQGCSSSIGGGEGNLTCNDYSNVAGGYFNCAINDSAVVGGGRNNVASGYASFIGGGYSNCSEAAGSVVGGGYVNTASGIYSVVSGGRDNVASAFYSNVAGGQGNIASGCYANVAGGCCNTASGYYANVAGGCCNVASGCYSAVLGGCSNNTNSLSSTFILGSNIVASQSDTTYVNNLSSQGVVAASNIEIFSAAADQSPLSISAYNLYDGVGILRLEGSEPDIDFNQVGGSGYNTFTFSREGNARIAIGRRGDDDNFYITRNPNNDGWYDDTFVIDVSSGNVGIGVYDPQEALDVYGNITASGSATFNSVSAVSLSGTFYGDGSKLAGIVSSINGTTNQIDVSNSGTAVTLSLPNDVIFPKDVSVTGNLTVAGSATYVNTQNLVIGDNLIYLNDNNYGSNVLDTGFVSHFTQAPLGYNHTGLVRRAGQGIPGVWTLFSGLTTEPASAANIDWTDKNLRIDSLSANILGNLSGSYVSVGNGNSNQWNSAYVTSTAYQNVSSTYISKTLALAYSIAL